MKNIKYLLILLLLLTIYIVKKSYAKENLPLKDKIIYLDPGHGYLDPGTLYDNIYEKDINLSISLLLKDELTNLGAKVLMTRYGDYDLSKPKARYRKKSDFDNRILAINNSNANYYLSIHLNYLNDTNYYGAQVFYNNIFPENKMMAEIIQNNFNANLNVKREAKIIPSSTYMYSKLKIPGLLIECGFLSNEKERNLLVNSDYQKKIAKIIANSVLNF